MAVKNRDPIVEAAQALERGDLVLVERIAGDLLARDENAGALHVLALARVKQSRHEEALALFRRALAARPGEPRVLFQMGKLLVFMQRDAEAVKALEDALLWEPNFSDAWYELGEGRFHQREFALAAEAYRKVLSLNPGNQLAKLALALALKEDGRANEAEALFQQGLDAAQEPLLKAAFAFNLALTRYERGENEAALAGFTLASGLDPSRSAADLARAGLLAEMQRPDEALALLEDLIRREPQNGAAHENYNDLLHRLGRDGEFLKSYDRVPAAAPLLVGKASLLLKTGREEEAQRLFAEAVMREPDNLSARLGAAGALGRLGRHDEALELLEPALARNAYDPVLYHQLAVAALQARDPQKAEAMAEKSVALAPHDQYGLALLGSAWRMMDDARDEELNGYDELIRAFDLEPPDGYSSMGEFNAELYAWLDGMHSDSRAPLNQTLRSGTQTRGHIFGAGHELAEKLKVRIVQAVERYVAEAGSDPRHPFRARRGQGLRFAGSWSSRLADCGFHVNHIHPKGWISSCYYVGVPEAVKDRTQQQGWIKFGEPGFETGLGVRRAIQPAPGRLVLFPSYMWHGTIPFHDASPRTTIAFDMVPRG
jgi:tetratricopeptide (TPR) repeat protein